LGLDATSVPRPYAPRLKDRTSVYQPNPIKGNKPINIGHKYSVLSSLIKDRATNSNWSIPLDGKRITSFDTDIEVGIEQIKTFFDNCQSDIPEQLSVLVADTTYSNKNFLAPHKNNKKLSYY
jgi:hypothetical protein